VTGGRSQLAARYGTPVRLIPGWQVQPSTGPRHDQWSPTSAAGRRGLAIREARQYVPLLVGAAALVILSVRLLDRQPGRWRTIWKAFRR
jgi:hypothetical protein